MVQRGLDGTDSSPTLNTAAITTDNTPLGAPSAIALQLDSGSSEAMAARMTQLLMSHGLQMRSWRAGSIAPTVGLRGTAGFGTSFELASNTTYAADKIQARC